MYMNPLSSTRFTAQPVMQKKQPAFAAGNKAQIVKVEGFTPDGQGFVNVNIDGTKVRFPQNTTLSRLLEIIDKMKNTRLKMYG